MTARCPCRDPSGELLGLQAAVQQLQGSLLERQTQLGSRHGALEVRQRVPASAVQAPWQRVTRQQLARTHAGRAVSLVLWYASALPLLLPSLALHARFAKVDPACWRV